MVAAAAAQWAVQDWAVGGGELHKQRDWGGSIASLQLLYSHLLHSANSAISKTEKLVQQALLYQSTPMQFGFMQTGG